MANDFFKKFRIFLVIKSITFFWPTFSPHFPESYSFSKAVQWPLRKKRAINHLGAGPGHWGLPAEGGGAWPQPWSYQRRCGWSNSRCCHGHPDNKANRIQSQVNIKKTESFWLKKIRDIQNKQDKSHLVSVKKKHLTDEDLISEKCQHGCSFSLVLHFS